MTSLIPEYYFLIKNIKNTHHVLLGWADNFQSLHIIQNETIE